VGSENRLRNAIALTRPGTSVEIQVLREGQTQTMRAELVGLDRGRILALNAVEIPRLGVHARTSKDELRRGGEPIAGVQIVDYLDPGQRPMDASKLLPSDYVVGLARRSGEEFETWSIEDLTKALDRTQPGERVRLYVIRPMGGGYNEGYVDVEVR
jgi:hypothetical protein